MKHILTILLFLPLGLTAQLPNTVFRGTAQAGQAAASAFPGADWTVTIFYNSLANTQADSLQAGDLLLDGNCNPYTVLNIASPGMGNPALVLIDVQDDEATGQAPAGLGMIVNPKADGLIGIVNGAPDAVNDCASWYDRQKTQEALDNIMPFDTAYVDSLHALDLDLDPTNELFDPTYIEDSLTDIRTDLNAVWADVANDVEGSGAASHLAYWTGSGTIAHDASQLYWDATNNRLGIGTASPDYNLEVEHATSARISATSTATNGQGQLRALNSQGQEAIMAMFGSAFSTSYLRNKTYIGSGRTDLVLGVDINSGSGSDIYLSYADDLYLGPATSPKHIITDAGLIGVNTTTPIVALDIKPPTTGTAGVHITSSTTSDNRGLQLYQISENANSSTIRGYKARGAVGAPTKALATDYTSNYTFGAYTGTMYKQFGAFGHYLQSDADAANVQSIVFFSNDDQDNREPIAGNTVGIAIDENQRVGVRNLDPQYVFDISATTGARFPVGTTAQRPIGADGVYRTNSDTTAMEGYHSGAWRTYATRDWVRSYAPGGGFAGVNTGFGLLGNGTSGSALSVDTSATGLATQHDLTQISASDGIYSGSGSLGQNTEVSLAGFDLSFSDVGASVAGTHTFRDDLARFDFLNLGNSQFAYTKSDVNGLEVGYGTSTDIPVFRATPDTLFLGNYKFNPAATLGSGQDNYVLTYDDATGLIGLEAAAGGADGNGIYDSNGTITGARTVTFSDVLSFSAGASNSWTMTPSSPRATATAGGVQLDLRGDLGYGTMSVAGTEYSALEVYEYGEATLQTVDASAGTDAAVNVFTDNVRLRVNASNIFRAVEGGVEVLAGKYLDLQGGTDATRPIGAAGRVYYSDDSNVPTWYDGTTWQLTASRDWVQNNTTARGSSTATDTDPDASGLLTSYAESFLVVETTSGATSASQVLLPSPSATYANKRLTVVSVDASGTYNAEFSAGTGELYDGSSYTNTATIFGTVSVMCLPKPGGGYAWYIQ